MVGRQLRRVSHSQLLLDREIQEHAEKESLLRQELIQEQAQKKRKPVPVSSRCARLRSTA